MCFLRRRIATKWGNFGRGSSSWETGSKIFTTGKASDMPMSAAIQTFIRPEMHYTNSCVHIATTQYIRMETGDEANKLREDEVIFFPSVQCSTISASQGIKASGMSSQCDITSRGQIFPFISDFRRRFVIIKYSREKCAWNQFNSCVENLV